MREQRWTDAKGFSDLSAAVDEIYFLRALIADEATILESHLGYKTFPKTRRPFAEAQVDRMRRVARGEMYAATRQGFNQKRALRDAGADDVLTNHQWAKQRDLRPATTDGAAT